MSYKVPDNLTVKSEIDRISKKGFVTPLMVLQAATPARSPLHRYFVWDNTEAAHQYRLYQARNLLRSIVVEYHGDKEVRAFHNIKLDGGENFYASLDTIVKSENLTDQVIQQALKEIFLWKEKYKIYKQLNSIVEAIEELQKGE